MKDSGIDTDIFSAHSTRVRRRHKRQKTDGR
jgi:hypothetical protein